MANVDRPGGRDAELPDGTCSVAELNEEIEAVLRDAGDQFPTYVIGEISDVNRYDWGTFFDLRDLEEEAVVSCLAWSNTVNGLDHDLEAGASAVVQGTVDFHPDRGNCQLMVQDCWPLGESARVRELEELRSALKTEGLLDAARKQPLPAHPRCIGVVTSLSGSAREDVCSAIHDRAPGVEVKLCGATVQGENAVPSLLGAVERLDGDPDVDVLIVTRGGGADADLWCFNSEPLVRRLADCRTPVVGAIGHEDDRTLTDDVADERCMTPTDAGVTATPNVSVVRRSVGELARRIDDAYRVFVESRLDGAERRVEMAHESLQQTVATQRAERRGQVQRASALEARVDQAYETRIDRELSGLESRIESAYRKREADARVEAMRAEAQRLRVVVAVLSTVLVLGGVAVALLLWGVV